MVVTEFRTDDLPVADRFAGWCEVVSQGLAPHITTSDDAADFRAELRVIKSGLTQVSFLSCPSLHSRRTLQLVRKSDPELYQVVVCMRQKMALSQRRSYALVAPGDLFVYDTSHPYEAWGFAGDERVELTVVHVPRAALPLPANHVDGLLARVLSGNSAIGSILRSFLTSLANRGPALRAPDLARLGSTAVDLVTAYLAHNLDMSRAIPAESRDRVLLVAIYAFIEKHLSEDYLAPQVIADANHISLRYLHRLFQRDGRTVAGWIRTRRLERCRRDLEDPGLYHHPVCKIGARWGMANASDFNRSFRTAYGVPPGEWRRVAQRSP